MSNAPAYELTGPEFRADPYPTYHHLQEHDPVYFSPELNAWLITRYKDVREGLSHPAFSADRVTPRVEQFPSDRRPEFDRLVSVLSQWALLRDGSEHTHLRRPVSWATRPSSIQQFRPLVEQMVDRLLRQVPVDAPFNAVAELAVPLPLYVVGEMLGIAFDSVPMLKRCAVSIVDFFGSPPERYLATAATALHEIDETVAYLRDLVQHRRSDPQDDLISRMTQTLSDEAIVANCVMMVFAAFETTTNLLGNSLKLLLDNPGQLDRLRQDPSLLSGAIEEALRCETPVQRLSRMAVDDLELRGSHIRRGSLVFFMAGAANRDPDVFADPDTFDIARPNAARHLSFGYWTHACPGAGLARLEAEVFLSQLLHRFPCIRGEGAPVWHENLSVRALKTLMVSMSSGRDADDGHIPAGADALGIAGQ
ncbi:cytochrome P450 [Streptomyces sp. NPDC087659]|uniref:cytochrome P450 n=1 Tax=Streptomyces sp. NPDC087659 TaxID=3365801 RepID=UPI0038267BC0